MGYGNFSSSVVHYLSHALIDFGKCEMSVALCNCFLIRISSQFYCIYVELNTDIYNFKSKVFTKFAAL